MNKFRFTLPAILMIVGIILAMAGYDDAMLLMKGKTIDFNTAEQIDLEEKAMIEGNVEFVLGPFATLEETTKSRYGITTNKTETNFYIVGNFSYEEYEEWYNGGEGFDAFYTVLTVADQSKRFAFDSASSKWNAFFEGLAEYEAGTAPGIPVVPQVSVDFKGKLADDVTDPEYVEIRDETMKNLGLSGGEMTGLRIVYGELTTTSYVVFFGGIALALIGLVSLVISLFKAYRAKKDSELY
ncbi:MAG: hypothetical protein IJO99_06670 [Ruminococcus sp.]|nr:hypothetical protein [Ruminococcus sp.]